MMLRLGIFCLSYRFIGKLIGLSVLFCLFFYFSIVIYKYRIKSILLRWVKIFIYILNYFRLDVLWYRTFVLFFRILFIFFCWLGLFIYSWIFFLNWF